MDQISDQIVNDIERQRDELGRDLDELQSKVRVATDWKAQFEKHPYYFLGAAFGGGLLVSALAAGRSSREYYSSGSYSESSPSYSYSEPGPASSSYESSYDDGFSRPSSRTSSSGASGSAYQKHRAMNTLDTIKGALIAFAAAKAKEMLADMLPGFDRHYEETQRHVGRQTGLSSETDASSMSSPSATHGSGTSSGSSTYGGPASQGKPTTGGSYGSGTAPVSGGSFQSPGASPWSAGGSHVRPSDSSKTP